MSAEKDPGKTAGKSSASAPATDAGVKRPPDPAKKTKPDKNAARVREIGGPKNPDPTRYGDWERKGRCIDF